MPVLTSLVERLLPHRRSRTISTTTTTPPRSSLHHPRPHKASENPEHLPPANSRASTKSTIPPSIVINPSSSNPPPLPSNNPSSTLAHRLNELSIANADGLLGDEEYRLLRQNLFERFGAASQVPTEAPVVRVAPAGSVKDKSRKDSKTSASAPATPSANQGPQIDPKFHVSRRPQSVRSSTSRNSIATTVTGIFRRGASRPSESGDSPGTPHSRLSSSATRDDSISLFSGGSQSRNSSILRPSLTAPRSIAYQSSAPSLHSTYSRHTSRSRSGSQSRSTKGPPSSFHHPSSHSMPSPLSNTNGYHTLPYTLRQSHHDTALSDEVYSAKSAAELRSEIVAVEAEGKRLMDLFNGLEISALTKHRSGNGSNALNLGAGLELLDDEGDGALARRSASVPSTPKSLPMSKGSPFKSSPAKLDRTLPPSTPSKPSKSRGESLKHSLSLSFSASSLVRTASSKFASATSNSSPSPNTRPNTASGSGSGSTTGMTVPQGSIGRKHSFSLKRGKTSMEKIPPLPTSTSSPILTGSSPHLPLPSALTNLNSNKSSASIASNATTTSPRGLALVPVPPLPTSVVETPQISIDTSPPQVQLNNTRTPNGNTSLPSSVSAPSALGGSIDDETIKESRAFRTEIEEIRKSRVGTVARYEQRLEYLRAKLRAAELREKLLK